MISTLIMHSTNYDQSHHLTKPKSTNVQCTLIETEYSASINYLSQTGKNWPCHILLHTVTQKVHFRLLTISHRMVEISITLLQQW